jgi:small neutral amino acid transporter SnatA (MarC family)
MLQYLFFTKDRTFWKVVEIATPIISGDDALSIGIIWIVAKLHYRRLRVLVISDTLY